MPNSLATPGRYVAYKQIMPTLPSHPAALPPVFDFNQAPLLVIWESTRSCALACDHCRANADTTTHLQAASAALTALARQGWDIDINALPDRAYHIQLLDPRHRVPETPHLLDRRRKPPAT